MQQKKNFFPVFLTFFVITLFIFIFSSVGLLNGLTSFLEQLTVPLQRFTFGVVHKNDQTEIAKLKAENISLTAQLIKQTELQRENQALKDQFQATNPDPRKLLPANVIGVFNDQMIIDKGISDGVKTGFVLVVKDNLVGKIVKTSAHISVFDLITGNHISFTAKTLKTQTLGIIKGQDGGLIFDNVVLSDKLEKDDTVVTKGDIDAQGVGFPPNLVVGKIVSVNKKASSLFQNAEVRSLVSVKSLEMVFVLIQ